MTRPLIYIACPYSDPNEDKRMYRIDEACRWAALLFNQGLSVFSPLSHGFAFVDNIAIAENTHERWLALDKAILAHCDAMLIVQIAGWNTSRGVLEEIEFCLRNSIPIYSTDGDIFLDWEQQTLFPT